MRRVPQRHKTHTHPRALLISVSLWRTSGLQREDDGTPQPIMIRLSPWKPHTATAHAAVAKVWYSGRQRNTMYQYANYTKFPTWSLFSVFSIVSGCLCLLSKLKKNHITLCSLSFRQLAAVSLCADVNSTLNESFVQRRVRTKKLSLIVFMIAVCN